MHLWDTIVGPDIPYTIGVDIGHINCRGDDLYTYPGHQHAMNTVEGEDESKIYYGLRRLAELFGPVIIQEES